MIKYVSVIADFHVIHGDLDIPFLLPSRVKVTYTLIVPPFTHLLLRYFFVLTRFIFPLGKVRPPTDISASRMALPKGLGVFDGCFNRLNRSLRPLRRKVWGCGLCENPRYSEPLLVCHAAVPRHDDAWFRIFYPSDRDMRLNKNARMNIFYPCGVLTYFLIVLGYLPRPFLFNGFRGPVEQTLCRASPSYKTKLSGVKLKLQPSVYRASGPPVPRPVADDVSI
jgi:hypothetical protein